MYCHVLGLMHLYCGDLQCLFREAMRARFYSVRGGDGKATTTHRCPPTTTDRLAAIILRHLLQLCICPKVLIK